MTIASQPSRGRAPRVSVVVPARNAAGTIVRTLDALAKQDLDARFEVIVVDNGSDDGTAELAERHPAPVTVLRQSNLGPAEGRNRGAAEAAAPILAFTDSDCMPRSSWLRSGVNALTEADLVQGRVIPEPEAPIGPFDRSVWVERETGLYETANLFADRAMFERVGGFQPLFAPEQESPFGEDVWFGWRLRRAGGRTAFCPSAVVEHAVFARTAFEFVRDRLRWSRFPDLVALIPEVRREALFARLFLMRRTAMFDSALLGAVAAVLTRSPSALVAALPYLRRMRRLSRSWRGHRPLVLPVFLAADVVGLAALIRGSFRSRSPVL